MSTHSGESSSHSQDEDGRTPGVRLRGIQEYVKLPPPAPVISQFGSAFVDPPPPSPHPSTSTPQRKRDFESSSQSRNSNHSPEETWKRSRHSPSLPSRRYSRSYERGRSSSTTSADDELEEIIDEPKEIKELRKLVEGQAEERKELEERQQNKFNAAITTSAQKIIYLENKNRKKKVKINKLEDDLLKAEDKLEEQAQDRWTLNAVFESSDREVKELRITSEKQEGKIEKLDTTRKQLEAEKLKLLEKTENLKKQRDEAVKKQKEGENNLEVFRKNVEELQKQLKKEIADFDQNNAKLIESQKNAEESKQKAKEATDKLTKLEKELSEVIKSDNEGKENLVKIEQECRRLTGENAVLQASLTRQTTENVMVKEELAELRKTNKKLNIMVAQADKNMEAFYHGFMGKVEDEQSSSKSNIEEWIRSAKQELNIKDVHMSEEEHSITASSTSPKRNHSKMVREEDELIHTVKALMESIHKKNVKCFGIEKIKTTSSNATEETPVITSSTPHNSVDMERGFQSPPQAANSIASSTSTNISLRDVSDKTVSSSDKVKTSPSPSTSRGPPAIRPEAGRAQDSNFFMPVSPIPQMKPTEIGTNLPTVSPKNYTNQPCIWCKKDFPSMLLAARHVCDSPRDPRIVKQQQKKLQ